MGVAVGVDLLFCPIASPTILPYWKAVKLNFLFRGSALLAQPFLPTVQLSLHPPTARSPPRSRMSPAGLRRHATS